MYYTKPIKMATMKTEGLELKIIFLEKSYVSEMIAYIFSTYFISNQ